MLSKIHFGFVCLHSRFSSLIEKYKNDERGVTAIEYGLIGVAMATLLGTTLTSSDGMITELTAVFENIAKALKAAGTVKTG